MWFWWFMLACDVLIPAILIFGGVLMCKRTPKKINSLCGYRTSRSMKNMDTWTFAHRYCGRLWWLIGAIILIPSVIVHIPFYHSDENVIGLLSSIVMIVQFIALSVPLIMTESALKKTFCDDGTKR